MDSHLEGRLLRVGVLKNVGGLVGPVQQAIRDELRDLRSLTSPHRRLWFTGDSVPNRLHLRVGEWTLSADGGINPHSVLVVR